MKEYIKILAAIILFIVLTYIIISARMAFDNWWIGNSSSVQNLEKRITALEDIIKDKDEKN